MVFKRESEGKKQMSNNRSIDHKNNEQYKDAWGFYSWHLFTDQRIVYSGDQLDTIAYLDHKLFDLSRYQHKMDIHSDESRRIIDTSFAIMKHLDIIHEEAVDLFFEKQFNNDRLMIIKDAEETILQFLEETKLETDSYHKVIYSPEIEYDERKRNAYEQVRFLIIQHRRFLSEDDQRLLKEFAIDQIESHLDGHRMDAKEYDKIDKQTASPLFIKQGPHTNQLSKLNTKTSKEIMMESFSDRATFKVGKLSVIIKGFINRKTYFDAYTSRLLNLMLIESSNNGFSDPTITIPIKRYMELHRMTNVDKARKRIRENLNNLFEITLYFDGKNDSYAEYNNREIKILEMKQDLKNGNIQATFGGTFFKMVKDFTSMYYPQAMFYINVKYNPNSYYFMAKASEHKRINYGRKNSDVLSVRTLLESSPTMPKYSEIIDKGQIKQRLKFPFERDLDACDDEFAWKYTKDKNEIDRSMTDGMTFEEWSSLSVNIQWKNYPVIRKYPTHP